MKKIILSTSLIMVLFTPKNIDAQVVEQGTIIIDGYYGFPNLYTTVLKAAYANSGTEENIGIGGLGPLGIRGEYLVSDKVGVGLDVGLNSSSVTYDNIVETVVYDGQGNPTYTTNNYTEKVSTSKFGVMITLNYHFIENDKVDFYGMFGAGYGRRTFKYESNNPNFEEASVKGLIPVASRLGIGVRYFFSENLGINLALGFGQGGLANAGVSFKL